MSGTGIRPQKLSPSRHSRRLVWAGVAALLLPFLLFHLLNLLFPFPQERLRDALSASAPILRAADGSLIAWRVDANENWRLPVRLSGVSPWLRSATVAVEDKRFYRHFGVDPVAVARAAAQHLLYWKRISGASTLSMQTVRLLWPRPRRLANKVVEAFRAVQLEKLVGKEGILELYFNLAPYGGNIVGAEAAARKYFGKQAAGLTLGEASLLAGIPQSPSRLDPRRRPELALLRRRQVLDRMAATGAIRQDEAAAAAGEDLELAPLSSRLDMPHFAEWLLSAQAGGAGEVVAGINPEWQEKIEELAARRAREWSGKGLTGPAVIVLSVRNSSVHAYLGNAPDRSAPGSQIDWARAPRQPGSLLKPFIFASLADSGKITPSSRVYDIPSSWNGYAPRNLDRGWEGELSAGDALRQSRNIPAVRQLADLGLEPFAATLSDLGLDPGQPGRLGLSLALGSREQRLVDLANAYAALGRLGRWLPLQTTADAPETAAGRRVWSEEAAWLTLSALAPPAEAAAPARAWKTGTSWNQRDAWAMVVTPEAVVGVWAGRRTGGGGQAVGAEDALPFALDIVDALGLGRGPGWPAPSGVAFAQVCAASGEPPGWACPELTTSPVNARHLESRQCRRHAALLSGAPSPTDADQAGPAEGNFPGKRLRIVSPAAGASFVTGAGGAETVYFLAEAAPGREALHWFVDGRRIAVSNPGERVSWTLGRGSHVVTVTAGGESDRSHFSVVAMGQ